MRMKLKAVRAFRCPLSIARHRSVAGNRGVQRTSLRGNATARQAARPTFFFLRSYPLLIAYGVQVACALAATNEGDFDDIPALAPPRGEIPPTFWEQYGLLVALAGGVLLVGALVMLWRVTRPKPPVVAPIEVQTRETLLNLRDRPESGALLSQISQTLRHYIAGAFSLPPVELTTSEFCQAVAGNGTVGPALSSALGQFLRRCDEQKFSPAIKPPIGAAAQALNLVDLAEARREQLRAAELSRQQQAMSNSE